MRGYLVLAILVQPCLSNFNPPLWPCNTEHDVHSVHENMHSPEWFKQAGSPVGIPVPAIRQFIDIGISWRPNYVPLFTGLGPFVGKNTLAVYHDSVVVTWKPPPSLFRGEVQRYEFDSQSLTLGGDFPPFTSAGFVPERNDEWIWLTVRGVARVFVVYIPGLSQAVYHDMWVGSVGAGSDAFLGCYPSQLDEYNSAAPSVTFACMSGMRVYLMESTLSLVASPIPDRGLVISVSTDIDMSFAITAPPSVQRFPIFITKQRGLGMPGVLVYRCGSSPFDIWCTRRYQDYKPSSERTLITSNFLGQTESGIFLGGVYGANSMVVYFLDRASLVLHTFDLAALHNRPVNSMRLSQPHPQRPVFGGQMWHYQHAGHQSKFSLSHDNKVVFYEREVCRACIPCKEGLEFSSTLCNPLHNVDSVCESCRACSAGQFMVQGTCKLNLDTSCEWCKFHHPCEEDCGSQECPYGEYVTDRCDGLAVLPGGSSGSAACIACDGVCPYNQYMGLDCSCLLCATGTGDCSPGQFIGGCTGPDQNTCTDCKYHPLTRPCPADHYHAQVCGTGNDGSDVSTCLPCAITADGCPDNLMPIACTSSSIRDDSACIGCGLDAVQGTYFCEQCQACECSAQDCPEYFYLVGCEGDGLVDNHRCAKEYFSCGGECLHGQYVSTVCDYDLEVRRGCSNCSSCGSGRYISTPCTALGDTSCSLCTPFPGACPALHFWEECTSRQDSGCKPCAAVLCGEGFFSAGCDGAGDIPKDFSCIRCTDNTCQEGYFRTECGGSLDSVCVRCNPECGHNEYESVPCNGTTNRVCSPCTPCPDGFFVAKACVLQDTVCKPCSASCSALHEWEEESCDPMQGNDRACLPCSECSQQVVQECTTGSNTICQECSKTCAEGTFLSSGCECKPCRGPCEGNTYQKRDCTGNWDRVCMPCSGGCEDGRYLIARCDDNNDAICRACSTSCPEDHYMSEKCDEGSETDVVCSQCSRPCVAGTSRETRACSEINDRVCEPCGGCPEEYYRDKGTPCEGFANGCSRCTRCGPGFFQIKGCEDMHDYQCLKCRPPCGVGEYERAPCSEDSDRECAPCSIGQCQAGYYRKSQCTVYSDLVCEPCSKCTEGFYNAGTGCKGGVDTVCLPCSRQCSQGMYISSGCTASRDIVCTRCSAGLCEVGLFESERCSHDRDRQCSPCSTGPCPLNSFKSTECNITSDRICRTCGPKCAAGSFQSSVCTEGLDHACTECTGCGEAQFVVAGTCSGNMDSICRDCQISCPKGFEISSPCSNSSDILCKRIEKGM